MVESGESTNGDGDEGGVRKARAARAEALRRQSAAAKRLTIDDERRRGRRLRERRCSVRIRVMVLNHRVCCSGLQRLGSDVRVDPSALVQANRKA